MQPESKIEKLLRAYAKRRRAAAGDSFSLSPARRRRLQKEVLRLRNQGSGAAPTLSLSIWNFLLRRWAFVTLSGAAIIVGAILILPMVTSSTSKPKFPAVVAMKSEALIRPMPAVSPAAFPPPVPASLSDSSPPPNRSPMAGATVSLADGTTNLVSPKLALNEPMNADTAGVGRYGFKQEGTSIVASFASGRRERVMVEKPGSGGAEVAALGAASSLAAPPSGNLAGTFQPVLTVTNSFNLALDSSLQPATIQYGKQNGSYQNVAASAKATPVLTRFKVTQNGGDIQIEDFDGSIYRGSWAPKVAQDSATRYFLNGNNRASAQNAQPPSEGVVQSQNAAANVQTVSQVYSVKVSGDNRTLKQRVVFFGDLSVVMTANAFANNAGTVDGLAQNARANGVSNVSQRENNQNAVVNGAGGQALWLNSFIVGNATVAGTNQFQINAIAVGP